MKRAIALFLALIFCFTLIPVSALADEEPALKVYYDEGLDPATTTIEARSVVVPATGSNAVITQEDTTLSSPGDFVMVQAVASTGMEFDCWVVNGTDIKSKTAYKANHTRTSAIEVYAKYKNAETTAFTVDGPNDVTVSVNDADSVDGSFSVTAVKDDVIRVRVSNGNGTDARLKSVTLKDDDGNPIPTSTTPAPTLAYTNEDADGQEYSVYAFTMPAQNVTVAVSYEYLLRVVGATLSSGGTTGWVNPGTMALTVTQEAGKSPEDILNWTSSPSVTFTDDAMTPKTKKSFTMPSAPLTIFVNYNVQHVLTASGIDESVGLIRNGTNSVKEGATVSVKPKLDPGHSFVDWTVTPNPADTPIDISQRTEEGLIFTMPKCDVTIACNTTADDFNLYLPSAPATGSTPATAGNHLITVGATVTLIAPDKSQATPPEFCTGWTAKKDNGDNIDLTELEGYTWDKTARKVTFKMPAYNIASIEPVYIAPTYKLTTREASAYKIGTAAWVTTNATDVDADYSAQVKIDAQKDSDSQKFDHWEYTKTGVAEPANLTETPAEGMTTAAQTAFNMPISGYESGGSLTVTAKYKYKVTLATQYGTINSTQTFFAPGETVKITAAAAPTAGDVFSGWSAWKTSDGTAQTLEGWNPNEAVTTFTMPENAVTITALFQTPNTVTMGTGGTVRVTGTATGYSTMKVAAGKSLTATASPTKDGKAFDYWTASGITLTPEQTYSRIFDFTMPGANVTLTPYYNTARTVSVSGGTVKSASETTGVTSGKFAEGKSVTITANAVAGQRFLRWDFTTKPTSGKATTIAIADASNYTFTIAANTNYSAIARYEQLYSLTLQNNALAYNGNEGKHLEMDRAAAANIPAIDLESADGETSLTERFSVGDVVTIKTPVKVKDQSGAEVAFTNWILVSGKGTIANTSSAETTFSVTSSNAILAARYGGNVLIYKDAERAAVKDSSGNIISPATIFYTNWTYENHRQGDEIILTAAEGDGTEFSGWVCEPSDLIRTVSGRTIRFNMPTGVVKVYPSYEHKLTMTDGMYSLDGTTWIRGEGTGKAVSVPAGSTVWIKPLDASMAAPGDGTYTFTSWTSNSSRVGYQDNVASTSFTMPPEDVEITCNYRTYTLRVQRTVDHRQETYSLRPGQYITLDSGEATGGRQFNYWTHTRGLLFTVNDTKYDEKYTGRLLSQRITVQMPNSDAEIIAWFSAFDNPYYWSTDAFIRIKGEPKRYYALLESFLPYSMEVIYYPGAGEPGNVVDPRDYRIDIVKAGTFDTSGVDANRMFIAEGAYDLLITMYIDGVQWAPTIRVMNDAYTHLYCSAEKPEFVRTFTKPAKTVYFERENVLKDGLDIQLLSVNHVTGTLRYSVQRELAESEYQLYPRCYVNVNSNGDATGLKDGATTKLPTISEIETMIGNNTPGVKLENGKYYVQMWVYCLNSALLDTDGNPTIMQYLINDEEDKIWVEVRRSLSNLQLAAQTGTNITDVTNNVPSTTYPQLSWEITMQAGMGERKLNISAPGSSMTDKEKAEAIEIVNSDPNVAYLVDTSLSTPLEKKLVVKAPGVTTLTIKARGSETVKATCEVTVRSTDIKGMTGFTALNKQAVTLFVGNTLTLSPYEFAPADANTACKWEVRFADNLTPQNANYYVSVSEAGVVKVLKPTNRKVIVEATPLNWAGGGVVPTIPCEITVIQVPVDNMTISSATKTMYRLSSAKLKVALYPEAASVKDVIWTSTDSSIVSVDNDGNIVAHKLGTATITATAASSIPEDTGDMTKAVFQTCQVTVRESVLLTSLMLNKTNIMLGIDDTVVISPYYTPATATTKGVTWTSSDTAIATVDANGKVRGLADGAVLIKATASDGSGLSASCVVTVTKIVSSAVVLNKQTLALIEDESETLVATVYPTNVSNARVNWTSSNENVAIVDPDGVVTAVGGGSVVITATAKDASTKYADCVVAVTPKIPVTSLTLNLGNFDMLLNDTTVLTPTVAPANATYKALWTSSDETVAKIDEKGKLSALKTGSAIITCKAGDMTKAITVNVVTKTFSTGKVVNCSRRVNVRANSSGTSTILGYAYLGDVYKVLDKVGNWYKIQYNASTTAFIWSSYLNATETSAGYVSAGKVGATTDTTGTGTGTTTTPVPVANKTITITNCTYCVNVRSGAGTNFTKLGYAYLDEVFPYTAVSGDWYTITYNGSTAYVSSQFVKVNG